MTVCRIALANLRIPSSPAESLHLAVDAIGDAASAGARVVCFPECFVPGYRWPGQPSPPIDPQFLDHALREVGRAARTARIAVLLGTERVTPVGLQIAVAVYGPDGEILGWQDKGSCSA
jgi:predicted amidohydrolase